MRMTRIAVAAASAAAVAAAVTLPTLSDAATASRGTSYAATTGGTGHVAVTFSRDGRQVTRAVAGYGLKCSDTDKFSDWDSFKAIPVSARGAFKDSYDSGVTRADDGATSRWTGRINGRRNSLRTQVTGSYRFTAEFVSPDGSKKVTCDTGTVSYTARD